MKFSVVCFCVVDCFDFASITLIVLVIVIIGNAILKYYLFSLLFADDLQKRRLENYLCKLLKKYFDHPETLVQLYHYPYIPDA